MSALTSLDDRVAVVTGGASGMGRVIARYLAESGARVVIVDRAGDLAAAAAADLALPGHGPVGHLVADLAHEEQVRRVVAEIHGEHGQIDVWCNNAGIGSSSGAVKSVVETTEEEWDAVLAVNLRSVGMCCKHVLPLMAAAGGGSIVNTSSISGIIGTGNTDAYSASKGGVVALTRSLAMDWADRNIRVNCVCPGSIETPMYAAVPAPIRAKDIASTPLGRIGRPEEVAAVVWFLATDASAYMTGAILAVDGGWTAG